MPVLRYFVFVGAALLALLFVVAEAFPEVPVVNGASSTTEAAAADIPTIRIHTDRKWPERVVFDTSAPSTSPQTVVAAVPASTQAASNGMRAAALADVADAHVADVGIKVTTRDAFAQLSPSDLKTVTPKPQPKHKIAKRHVAPPAIQVAQRPQFGPFANNIW
jgi:hypothetical protein